MSPRDVYPEGSVMWQRGGESWADRCGRPGARRGGRGAGRRPGAGSACVPDPAVTSPTKAVQTAPLGLVSQDSAAGSRRWTVLGVAGHGERAATPPLAEEHGTLGDPPRESSRSEKDAASCPL